jgi:hypothetical protein
MEVRISNQGDYWVAEVCDDEGRTLIRVGFDHEPSREEIDTVLEQDLISSDPSVLAGDYSEEVLLQWQP